jgi:hypothetical protein
MDTLLYIPRTTAGEKPDPDDPRAPCDCQRSLPTWGAGFEGAAWHLATPCGHIVHLASRRLIPWAGTTDTAYRRVWNTITAFVRNHPHLRPADCDTAVSGWEPNPMLPETYPGCYWAKWAWWDGPGPKPRPMSATYEYNLKHPLQPNENRSIFDNFFMDPGNPPGTPWSDTPTSRAAWPLPPLK